ncbi:MAG: VOC family protein [Robiginitomaculum sp.]|nr:VOC family protein [Robiginitomaculum sp.]
MRLNQVTLAAIDIEKSLHWYLNLGFRLIVSTSAYKRLSTPNGESTLSLQATNQPPNAASAKVYLEFESAQQLDQQVKRLVKLGSQFEMKPIDQTWLWREAWLKDPTGNRICLYFAGDNRLNPPWRVRS